MTIQEMKKKKQEKAFSQLKEVHQFRCRKASGELTNQTVCYNMQVYTCIRSSYVG